MISGEKSWKSKYYLFEVEVYVHSTGQVEHNFVTDPYSFSLAMNSTRSQIVDLRDKTLKPSGWDTLKKPRLAAPEDISIYELHVRDFSASDPQVPDRLRGTFKAFTLKNTYGIRHLKELVKAGLTHLHLLPVFDIATINENKAEWQSPDPDLLETYPPDSDQQQAAVSEFADLDAFNWGYDPFHYTVPEGSYSTNPDGSRRVVEFREMVQALNRLGLRVVMDVVYNHTNASGQAEKSVLDRIVPGYYHRLNDRGAVETSTCCSNTATEHNMMEKLMIDSLVTWATQYKVDGFRFDLMGHHMVRNMQKVRLALDELTLADDGVDGKSIYIYGEGWNFGEVANNARGENATQFNLAGTGIGTFNDRARDSVRGIGPFDGGQGLLDKQGFANGSYYDPSSTVSGTPEEQLARLLLQSDQTRVGMAGNLANFTFIDRFGNLVTGADVDYNGSPAGYNLDPQEDISYVEAHDNQTLFDINVYAAPPLTSMADRVRMQIVGLSTVVLGQGVPFIHAGSELLRSKSLDRNSYNSGDWFNVLDFTFWRNNFGVGLPPAGSNQGDWSVMQPLLADPALAASKVYIDRSDRLFRELLRIRYSSRLFRLQTAEDIQARLAFLNTGPDQLPGLIVMTLSDALDPDIDPGIESIVVLVNANDEAQTFTAAELADKKMVLHPVQQGSVDPVVKTARYDRATGAFSVPARTTVVFVEYERPAVRIAHLIEEIQALVAGGSLTSGQGNSLIAKLESAIQSLAQGKNVAAVGKLLAFVNQVSAYIRTGKLSSELGLPLILTAKDIIWQILTGA
jgi:pullulanase-type alpha-1,6-glucosidase